MGTTGSRECCPCPGRRSFCCQACAAVALALLSGALRAQPPAGTEGEDPLRVTAETRTGMLAGTVKDYRKQGGFFLVADAGGIYALTAICTHNGCKVRLEDKGFSCPCHDSAYDLQGTVLQGPARLPLKHFEVAEANPGGPLVVNRARVVDPRVRL